MRYYNVRVKEEKNDIPPRPEGYVCSADNEEEALDVYALELGLMPEDLVIRRATPEEVMILTGESGLLQNQLARLDEVDNAVYASLCTLAEKKLDWDMEIIMEGIEALTDLLRKRNIKVSYPGHQTNPDGSEFVTEYI